MSKLMNEQIESLIKFCKVEGKICPQPQRWNELWEMLPDKKRVGSGWFPSAPLILAAWWDTSNEMKQERLMEHLHYAEKKGALNKIGSFLRNLPEEDWFKDR